MCNYIILANNNNCASSSCKHQLVQPTCALHHQEQSQFQSGLNMRLVRCISPEFILQDWLQGYTLYVRNLTDPSCVTISGSTILFYPPRLFRQLQSVTPICGAVWRYCVTRNQGLNIVWRNNLSIFEYISGLTRMIILYMFRHQIILVWQCRHRW
jgi:hypothetical protein